MSQTFPERKPMNEQQVQAWANEIAEQVRWLDKLQERAGDLQSMFTECPHCRQIGLVDCVMCDTVYHAGEMMLAYVRMLRTVSIPKEIPGA
jgi:hypothetical protein